MSLGGLPPDEEAGEPRDRRRPTDCGPAKGRTHEAEEKEEGNGHITTSKKGLCRMVEEN